MKDLTSVETLAIPSDVTVKVKARTITVEGPRGSLTKNVGHVAMDIQVVSRDRWEEYLAGGNMRGEARASLEWQREAKRSVEEGKRRAETGRGRGRRG